MRYTEQEQARVDQLMTDLDWLFQPMTHEEYQQLQNGLSDLVGFSVTGTQLATVFGKSDSRMSLYRSGARPIPPAIALGLRLLHNNLLTYGNLE